MKRIFYKEFVIDFYNFQFVPTIFDDLFNHFHQNLSSNFVFHVVVSLLGAGNTSVNFCIS